MSRTFVGFGFGPIQAGLFIHEALESGNFGRVVISEIDGPLVEAVRSNHGTFTVNVAHSDGIRKVTHGGIEIYDPARLDHRETIIEAVADADEMATAVPKVDSYRSEDGTGIDCLIREGLKRKAARQGPRRCVVYAAENHNRAAEILQEEVFKGLTPTEAAQVPSSVQFLNTVIGKMSQRVNDPHEIAALGLGPITPQSSGAFLVEAFRSILISRITLEGFRRGITAFVEKGNLLPFEEAKLYGHNAIHALMGYLAALKGYECMSDIGPDDDIRKVGREAFVEESGATLIRVHEGEDRLFTQEGYAAYADDLLKRMTNPYLRDTIGRVCRDPARKLGYRDRLVGLMRLALQVGVSPRLIGLGAAAALMYLNGNLSAESIAPTLARVWGRRVDESEEVLPFIRSGFGWLSEWRSTGGSFCGYSKQWGAHGRAI